ncbi:MAG TPA: tetratricopeptide repeat protein [Candidatus Polarisedimenticolia bacterium]|nr:tetratricopeptide repeat protein [Candidatus Polarisedimenticolia bacterium]
MICPMLSALKPTDENGNPVDRECIYENCRFFNIPQRDCNLMMASRAMLDLAQHAPPPASPTLSPTALADMERRLTDVGKGILHSSMEVQEVVRQAGQESIARLADMGDSLARRLLGIEQQIQSGPRDGDTKASAGLEEVVRQSGQESIARLADMGDSLARRLLGIEQQMVSGSQAGDTGLSSGLQNIEGRLTSGLREIEGRIAAALEESEARTAKGLQAYLGEMRASFDETIGRVQARLEEQGRGVGATAAAASQSLDQLAALTDLQQKVAERLLEEMSLLTASIRKAEQLVTALDKKVDKSAAEGVQLSQQLLLVKGQSEKTHAALRGLHEGNRAVIQAVETQLQRDQVDVARRQLQQAEECNNRGVALYYRGAMEASLAAFRRAVELRPDYAEAHNNLGLVFSKMGKEKEAAEAFQEALRLDPAMAEVYNNLGFLYHTSGQLDRAVEMFGQAIQNDADSAVAYTNLGNSFYGMKQPEKAVEAWRRALELDPMNENARRGLRMFQQDPSNN